MEEVLNDDIQASVDLEHAKSFIARKLLDKNVPVEQIAELIDLDEEEVIELHN